MSFDPNYLSSLAVAVDQSSNVESNLTSELSSGLRVTSLQDDPGAVANATVIGSAIARDDSYVQSSSGTQAMLQVADSTLGEVVTQVTSAMTLAVQAGDGTLNASNSCDDRAAVDGHSRPGAFAGEHELSWTAFVWWKPGIGAAVFAGYFDDSGYDDLFRRYKCAVDRDADGTEDTGERSGFGDLWRERRGSADCAESTDRRYFGRCVQRDCDKRQLGVERFAGAGIVAAQHSG